MKTPDPKTIAEIKGLSKKTKGEVVHTLFNGLCSVRIQLELDLQKQLSPEEIFKHFDNMADWFRAEFKQFGFME